MDDYSADITSLTVLTTPDRLNTLLSVMKKTLTDKEADSDELLGKLDYYTKSILGYEETNGEFCVIGEGQNFYTEIRPIDAWCCINRMRGVSFKRSSERRT